MQGATPDSESVTKTISIGRFRVSRFLLLTVCSLVGVIMLAGCMESPHNSVHAKTTDTVETAVDHAVKHLDSTYVCPMHPGIVNDSPGQSCPICGMDLEPRTIKQVSTDRPEVSLDPAVIQNIGVRTAKVQRGDLWKYIRTQGKVVYDEDRVLNIHPRSAGWIETLYVRTDGVKITGHDTLADYLSPLVLYTQTELLGALEAGEDHAFDAELDADGHDQQRGTDYKSRINGAREMLRNLKVPNRWIKSVENSYTPRASVPIKSPQGGVVTKVHVNEGMFVRPQDTLFTVVDLSEVWVMVDVFESQLEWVKPGLTAEITTPAYPGRKWEGKVEFVYPEVHPRARTLRARLEFRNPDEALLPNMFVEAVIYGGPKRDTLALPKEALILTGERELVVKVTGEGSFQPIEVKTGMWRGSKVEILEGLEAGDEVVTSGQFLIDSESSMQASFARMSSVR